MKKVFIIISSLGSGGAERSLISFLKSLEARGLYTEYSIDLMVVLPNGLFMNQIPSFVNVIKADPATIWLGVGLRQSYLYKNFSLIGVYGKIKCFLHKKLGIHSRKFNEEQLQWQSWNGLIPDYNGEYDVAISYLEGFPNYYVMEKVKATKKVLWIHNEYQQLKFDAEYDRPYFNDCDRIITISQKCVNSFAEVFPEYAEKISILENITVNSEILEKSNQYIPQEFSEYQGLKLLSIGRLVEQKGFDFAVEAARILKESVPDFLWLILGDGPDREALTKQIADANLEDNFKLAGIKDNPYAYIKNADIFVQTSRYEGKSIALDETKILLKPIVVTDYPTVRDNIIDGVNGSIVAMNPKSIAEGIVSLYSDKELQQNYINNLKNTNKDNGEELKKYLSIML